MITLITSPPQGVALAHSKPEKEQGTDTETYPEEQVPSVKPAKEENQSHPGEDGKAHPDEETNQIDQINQGTPPSGHQNCLATSCTRH